MSDSNKNVIRRVYGEISQGRVEILEELVADDEFMGIEATGNRISVPFADFFRIENGRIAEHWGVSDTGSMMQQLGAMEG